MTLVLRSARDHLVQRYLDEMGPLPTLSSNAVEALKERASVVQEQIARSIGRPTRESDSVPHRLRPVLGALAPAVGRELATLLRFISTAASSIGEHAQSLGPRATSELRALQRAAETGCQLAEHLTFLSKLDDESSSLIRPSTLATRIVALFQPLCVDREILLQVSLTPSIQEPPVPRELLSEALLRSLFVAADLARNGGEIVLAQRAPDAQSERHRLIVRCIFPVLLLTQPPRLRAARDELRSASQALASHGMTLIESLDGTTLTTSIHLPVL